MKALRFAVLAPILLALISAFSSVIPSSSPIAQLLMPASTIFGLSTLCIAWFIYFMQYRYSRVFILGYGLFSLPLVIVVLIGHYIRALKPLENLLVPHSNTFLFNLTYMFMAVYLIGILFYWLPRTKFLINTLLGVTLFIALLSSFGHLYTLKGIPQSSLLVPMPFGAILGFLILILAIFAYANRMEQLYLNPKIIIGFALMFIAVVVANIVVYQSIHSVVDLSNQIDATRAALGNIYDAGLSLNNAKADAQSYVITSNSAYAARYKVDQRAYQTTISAVLTHATADGRTDIEQHAKNMLSLSTQIFSLTDNLVAQKQHNTLSSDTHIQDSNSLQGYTDQALQEVKSIGTIYGNQVTALVAQEANGGRGVVVGVSMGSALSILMIIFTPLFIRETIQRLSATQKKLKKSNTLLADEKARAETILTSIGDGLFAVNRHHTVTLFNDAAERLTGIKKTDALGKLDSEVLHFVQQGPEEPDLNFTDHALAGIETHVDHNIALVHTKGHKIDVQISASPIKSSEQAIDGAIITVRDRTSEQALENAKDEFVALASHQLRTPATATKQFLAMFLQGYAGDITDKQRLFLQQAYDNNELGINIIEELLNITRLESGKTTIHKQRLDLIPFVEEAAARHKPVAEKAQQKIAVHVPKQHTFIRADESLLVMLLDNLISNALKYSFDGNTVTVSLVKERGKAILTIQDTGIGIEKENLSKIFTRFSRLEDPQKQHVSGTGIGLYLVQKIVDMHHAKIRVESDYGKGSRFIIEFKLNKE